MKGKSRQSICGSSKARDPSNETLRLVTQTHRLTGSEPSLVDQKIHKNKTLIPHFYLGEVSSWDMDTSSPAVFVNGELLQMYVGRKVRSVIQVIRYDGGAVTGKSTDELQLIIKGSPPPIPLMSYVEVIGIAESKQSIHADIWTNFGNTFDTYMYNQLCQLANGEFKGAYTYGPKSLLSSKLAHTTMYNSREPGEPLKEVVANPELSVRGGGHQSEVGDRRTWSQIKVTIGNANMRSSMLLTFTSESAASLPHIKEDPKEGRLQIELPLLVKTR
ncbi:hypothetical protein L1049_011010 [Liquidambar formosana]|uniref:Uncharacterized protein n=1 Tax=Liquidambar formosana TaxID=63359 RepID=A0AAP0WWR0_LIQFO